VSLISKSFGRRLRQTREKRGFKTARAFADLLAIEENTLTRWERGETEPGFDMLLRICQVLGTTPNELLLGSAPDAPKRKPAGSSERLANRT
jgi:transcriptional regulator with XRE-family HTH domain